MSSYAHLTLGSLSLELSRNGVDPDLIWLFRPSDKRIEQLTGRDSGSLREYIIEKYIDYFDDDHPFTYIEYRCTVEEVRDRLELKGFTLDVAKERFRTGLDHDIRHVEDSLTESGNRIELLRLANEDDLSVLSSLTMDSWLRAVGRIRAEGLDKDTLESTLHDDDMELPLLKYMLKSSTNLYGFPGSRLNVSTFDYMLFLRLVIESSPPSNQLIYDLSPLNDGGYIDAEDDLVALAASDMDTTAVFSQSVIVLTEGTTDRNFIERSLNLLYPHLAGYFHFFEFDLNPQNRVSGGVGPLVNLVRALAGSSVKQRILALFDNDTAAKEALRNLDPDILPRNIVFKYYPELPLAENYPTVGPTGRTTMNVNGLAGGIELYLGRDVLEEEDGQLIPVQWTGYSQGVDAYQGELLNKSAAQRRFREKLENCERNPDQLDCFDWTGMKAILDIMRNAFHTLDSDIIRSNCESLNCST